MQHLEAPLYVILPNKIKAKGFQKEMVTDIHSVFSENNNIQIVFRFDRLFHFRKILYYDQEDQALTMLP